MIDARGGGMRPRGGSPCARACAPRRTRAGRRDRLPADPGALRRRRLGRRVRRGRPVRRRLRRLRPARPRDSRPAQDPERDLKDFSAYVFTRTLEHLGADLRARRASRSPARSSCSTAAPCPPAAATRRPPSARSTARPTSASTSTSASTATWSASSARRATSPGRT